MKYTPVKKRKELNAEYYPASTLKYLHAVTDEIYDDFKNRVCKNCNFCTNEVCVNDDSPLCADFVAPDYGCVFFEEMR